jgi:hypothetical protein
MTLAQPLVDQRMRVVRQESILLTPLGNMALIGHCSGHLFVGARVGLGVFSRRKQRRNLLGESTVARLPRCISKNIFIVFVSLSDKYRENIIDESSSTHFLVN